MKLTLFSILLFVLPLSAFAQNSTSLNSGKWAGELQHNHQSTEIYLEFKHSNEDGFDAFITLPVTNFFELPLGTVTHEDSLFTAGSIQFQLADTGQTLTGSFNSSRELNFRLNSVDALPDQKEPFDNQSNATPVWNFQTGGPVWGAPAADNQHIYIGSSDGNLYALSQKNGEPEWSYKTNGAIFSRPLIDGGNIYILSDDSSLYKLESNTGSLIWKFDTGGQDWQRTLPDDEQPGYDTKASAAVIADATVFVGSADGHFYAIDKHSGAEKWRFKTGGPIHSIPVLAEGMIYFGSYDHHIYALNPSSGELIWKFDTGQLVLSDPVYADGKIMIGSRNADLFALNASTGDVEWTYFYWFSWVESSGVMFDDIFYIGSSDSQLLKSFDPKTGNLIWSADVGGSPWTTPAVTESTVYSGVFGNSNYFIDHRGGFFAVDRKTGNVKWHFMMDQQPDTHIYGVVSSPVVNNGMVFFGGLDGMVYGFKSM